MIHKSSLVAALALLASSCISTSVTRLVDTHYAETRPESVRIFLSERDVPGPFEKLAIIYAKGSTSMTDQEQMLEKGREEAAKVGANGLLLNDIAEASQGAQVAATIFGTSTSRNGEMVAVRYRRSNARAASRSTNRATVNGSPNRRSNGAPEVWTGD